MFPLNSGVISFTVSARLSLHPDPKARFRGSLIDDKMFAIDLNEWGLDNIMQEYRDRRLRSLPKEFTNEKR